MPIRRPLSKLGCLALCIVVRANTIAADAANQNNSNNDSTSKLDDVDCASGFCPNSEEEEITTSTSKKTATKQNANECGLWLGPSPIKNAEDHGFGLGMFTGKAIPKGTTVEAIFYTTNPPPHGQPNLGEVLLPLLGSEDIMDRHPPLREVLWEEDNLPEVAVEYPDTITALFIPGLAAIAPCTLSNFNLKILGKGNHGDMAAKNASSSNGRDAVVTNTAGVHRSRHATAGSFSYHPHVQYEAVRDIAPGEELTVECDDASYDGGNYFLSRYNANDDAVICVDKYVKVGLSTIAAGAGRGLFAKRSIGQGETIIATPLVTLTRNELKIQDVGVNSQQLMLNYCYGHPDSDLLLLPVGPMVNYLNHDGRNPNAKIRWHQSTMSAEQQANLERREEYHHYDEMETWSAEKVATTHGMGLVMDIVALRPIAADEEIRIDYGQDWQKSFDAHTAAWPFHEHADYVDAETYALSYNNDASQWIRTETEQYRNPYPKNLELFCFYALPRRKDVDDDDNVGGETEYMAWEDNNHHTCFRPCRILEKTLSTIDGEESVTLTVELRAIQNPRILVRCLIERDIILTNVPVHAIRLLNKPYSTDVLLPNAFRHEIGVPNGFYPSAWMRRNLRNGRLSASAKHKNDNSNDQGEEFKRKKSVIVNQPQDGSATAQEA